MNVRFDSCCRFCGARGFPPSTAGLYVCHNHDIAISVLEPTHRMGDDGYDDFVRNVGWLIEQFPQLSDQGEKFANYKVRLALISQTRPAPIPMQLFKPLSDEAVKGAMAGLDWFQVIAIAARPADRTRSPDIKKRADKDDKQLRPSPPKPKALKFS